MFSAHLCAYRYMQVYTYTYVHNYIHGQNVPILYSVPSSVMTTTANTSDMGTEASSRVGYSRKPVCTCIYTGNMRLCIASPHLCVCPYLCVYV